VDFLSSLNTLVGRTIPSDGADKGSKERIEVRRIAEKGAKKKKVGEKRDVNLGEKWDGVWGEKSSFTKKLGQEKTKRGSGCIRERRETKRKERCVRGLL